MNRVISVVAMILALVVQNSARAGSTDTPLHPSTDAYDGWRLSVQAWTFNKFTFAEAVEKAAAAGLRWIEAYPGQKVGGPVGDAGMGPGLSAQDREAVRQMLANAGVRLVNFGVTELKDDEADARRTFEFAKEMGIETIAAEPPPEALPMLDRLCGEYGVNVAIHNHPKPSPYWNPDRILEVTQGRSARIGACADIGHWLRSGIDPMDAIKKLKGRIIAFHFKDLNEAGKLEARDVVWGTGVANVEALLNELDRQKFTGVFSIEYEDNWDNNVPEVHQCVLAYEKMAGALKPGGWKRLIEEDLSNCVLPQGGWSMKGGVLSPTGDGLDIWTKERYGDFVLDLEFKLDTNTNSGVFLRTGSIEEWLHTAIEVQVLDSYGKKEVGREDCGAIFDCLAPRVNAVKPPGEWNRYTITARGSMITVVLNGKEIIEMDLNRWTEAHKNPDGTPNKFITAYRDMPRIGHIGLQYHGHPIWYRNLKILTLE